MGYVSEKRKHHLLILFFERVVGSPTLPPWCDRRIAMQAVPLEVHQAGSHFGNANAFHSQILQGNFYGLTISQACPSRDTTNR